MFGKGLALFAALIMPFCVAGCSATQYETRVAEFAAAQKRTEARMAELAEAQKRMEARMAELAEAHKRTVEAFAEAQKRTGAATACVVKDMPLGLPSEAYCLQSGCLATWEVWPVPPGRI